MFHGPTSYLLGNWVMSEVASTPVPATDRGLSIGRFHCSFRLATICTRSQAHTRLDAAPALPPAPARTPFGPGAAADSECSGRCLGAGPWPSAGGRSPAWVGGMWWWCRPRGRTERPRCVMLHGEGPGREQRGTHLGLRCGQLPWAQKRAPWARLRRSSPSLGASVPTAERCPAEGAP